MLIVVVDHQQHRLYSFARRSIGFEHAAAWVIPLDPPVVIRTTRRVHDTAIGSTASGERKTFSQMHPNVTTCPDDQATMARTHPTQARSRVRRTMNS